MTGHWRARLAVANTVSLGLVAWYLDVASEYVNSHEVPMVVRVSLSVLAAAWLTASIIMGLWWLCTKDTSGEAP